MSTICEIINFLEDYNSYKVEIFRINCFFDGLLNDISHFVVAQKFIICTCLRYVDITDFVNFLEHYNRYKVEIFRVNYFFKGLSNDIWLINVLSIETQNIIIDSKNLEDLSDSVI